MKEKKGGPARCSDRNGAKTKYQPESKRIRRFWQHYSAVDDIAELRATWWRLIATGVRLPAEAGIISITGGLVDRDSPAPKPDKSLAPTSTVVRPT